MQDSIIDDSHGVVYDAGMWLADHWSEISTVASDPVSLTTGAGAVVAGGVATLAGVRLGLSGIRSGVEALHGTPGDIRLGSLREKPAHRVTDPPVKLGFKDLCAGGVQVVGPPGQGKTTLLQSMALSHLLQGHTVVVIEADSDLGENLASYVGRLGLTDRFFRFDPSTKNSLKWNPLAGDTELAVRRAVDTISSVSKGHEFFESLNQDVLRHMVALACGYAKHVGGEATVALLLRLLADTNSLESILETGTDGSGRPKVGATFLTGDLKDWCEQEFLLWSEKTRREYLLGLRNVLRGLLSSDRVVDALTPKNDETTIDLDRALNSGGLILFKVSSAEFGRVAGRTLLTWALQHVQQATLGRAMPRRPICVMLDEAHVVLGSRNSAAAESYAEWFVQSRKFGCAPHVGYQSFSQLPDQLSDVLDSAARNKIFFGGLHHEDAHHAQELLGHTLRRREEIREIPSEIFLAPARRQKSYRTAEEPFLTLSEIENLPVGRCICRLLKNGRLLPPAIVRVKTPASPKRMFSRVPGAPIPAPRRRRRSR